MKKIIPLYITSLFILGGIIYAKNGVELGNTFFISILILNTIAYLLIIKKG